MLDQTCERLGLSRSDAVRALIPSHTGASDAFAMIAAATEPGGHALTAALEAGVRALLIEFSNIAPGDLPTLNELGSGQVFEYAKRYAAASSNALAPDLLVELPDLAILPEADRGRLALAPRGEEGQTCAARTEAAQRAGVGELALERWSLPAAIHRGPVEGVTVEPARPETLDEKVGRVTL